MGTVGRTMESAADDHRQGPLAIVKPRVLLLLVFSGAAGAVLATTRADASWTTLGWLLSGGIMATASANIFNNILDRERDSLMERTMWRPIPAGVVGPRHSGAIGALLGGAGLAVMCIQLNPLTALLTLFGMLFYIIVYTIVLKPLTTENITIGGVAGIFPPLVGWTAVSGELDLPPLFLGILVVLWTPPHFWSLALFHSDDYRRAGVPMLPVVRGEWETKRRIGVYTAALVIASYVLVLWEPLGPVYLVGVTVLDVPMLVLATMLMRTGTMDVARRLFAYSNAYLLSLFVLTMVDGAFI